MAHATKWQRVRELSWLDWQVLVHAAALLAAVEIALRLLPFRSLLRWAQRIRPSGKEAQAAPSAERTAWLVDVAARYGLLRGPLRPTCLRKSLALCALLTRRGLAARLVIGANASNASASGSKKDFQAHAWVELEGKILGAQSGAGYSELMAFEPIPSREQTA